MLRGPQCPETRMSGVPSELGTESLQRGAVKLGVGFVKEPFNRADGRFFSWRDLAAGVAGGATGAIVVRQTRG